MKEDQDLAGYPDQIDYLLIFHKKERQA